MLSLAWSTGSEVQVHPVLAPKETEFSGSVLWGENRTPGQHLLFAGCVTQRLLRASERE